MSRLYKPNRKFMRITLLCIGKVKSSWIAEGCRDYSERLERGLDFKVMELPASKEKDSDRQRADESARLFAAAQKFDGDLWILDERGKGMASEAFAKEHMPLAKISCAPMARCAKNANSSACGRTQTARFLRSAPPSCATEIFQGGEPSFFLHPPPAHRRPQT